MEKKYLRGLSNQKDHILERVKEAKELLRDFLSGHGNISEMDNVADCEKYTAYYTDDDGNAQSAYYRSMELLENRLYIGLSDEYCIFQENITVQNIYDIISIIEEGHGKFNK